MGYADDPTGGGGGPGPTGATGASGQMVYLPAEDPDEPYVIPGPRGDAGAAGGAGANGTSGSNGPAVFLLAEDGEDSWTPGPKGDTGLTGSTGSTGLTGSQGPATFLLAEDGEDSWVPGPQGGPGPAGVSPAMVFLPSEDGEDSWVPGPQGVAGPTGAAGASSSGGGASMPFVTGDEWDDGDWNSMPGPAGPSISSNTVTKQMWFPAGTWELEGTATFATAGVAPDEYNYITLPDAVSSGMLLHFPLPLDWASGTALTPVFYYAPNSASGAGASDIRWEWNLAQIIENTGVLMTASAGTSQSFTDVAASRTGEAALSNSQINTWIPTTAQSTQRLTIRRLGGNAADTYLASVKFRGILITYTALLPSGPTGPAGAVGLAGTPASATPQFNNEISNLFTYLFRRINLLEGVVNIRYDSTRDIPPPAEMTLLPQEASYGNPR